jgi:hypothetical protein
MVPYFPALTKAEVKTLARPRWQRKHLGIARRVRGDAGTSRRLPVAEITLRVSP